MSALSKLFSPTLKLLMPGGIRWIAVLVVLSSILRRDKTFTYDLFELGEFYLEYLQMMEHWDAVLPGEPFSECSMKMS